MNAATVPHSLIPAKVMVRKKIWDIASGYKCGLIGMCLDESELRKLGKEKVFGIRRDADDYYLHCAFIRFSDQRGEKSLALQHYLEKKFKAKTRKYLKATTDAELLSLWNTDLAEGRTDVAWWGILTHPGASPELVNRIYGEIHMLGHHCFKHWHKDHSRLEKLQEKADMLTDSISRERRRHRQEKQSWDTEKKDLNREIAVLRAFRRNPENHALSDKKPENAPAVALNAVQIQTMQNQIAALQNQLKNAHLQLEERMEREKEWRAEQEKLALEIASLEKMFLRSTPDAAPCDTCASQNTENCPGLDLCGKTVLYVGGHHKMVARYRQLVERCGGRFMHHDGGKEASRNLLPKMLLTADAVFCPIDCISHDACTRAKKMCKRYQKPFVPMRGSGISSLARGLDEMLQ